MRVASGESNDENESSKEVEQQE